MNPEGAGILIITMILGEVVLISLRATMTVEVESESKTSCLLPSTIMHLHIINLVPT